MRQLQLKPSGWPCTLKECPPGLFVFGEILGLKTEYSPENEIEAFCSDTGEAFWGGTHSHQNRDQLMVQPVEAVWEEK